MKLIIAFIKPHKLPFVTPALQRIERLSGVSVSETRGGSRGRAQNAPDMIREDAMAFVRGIRLEIACPNDLVEEVVSSIEKNACTKLSGDGKIYVLNVEQAVRISTGERGENAI